MGWAHASDALDKYVTHNQTYLQILCCMQSAKIQQHYSSSVLESKVSKGSFQNPQTMENDTIFIVWLYKFIIWWHMSVLQNSQAFLAANSESEDEDNGLVHLGKGYHLMKDVYDKLYPYQRECLLWFWRLHRKVKGGILGDDMG